MGKSTSHGCTGFKISNDNRDKNGDVNMKKIKIAYISTTGLDVFPLITALEELETEKGDVAEVILRSKGMSYAMNGLHSYPSDLFH